MYVSDDEDFDLDLVLDDKIEVLPADADLKVHTIETSVGEIHFASETHRGLAFQLWPAVRLQHLKNLIHPCPKCLAMCHFIETQSPGYWADKKILELGAGIGVASILLGKLGQFPEVHPFKFASGATVTATDLAEPCEMLRKNVADNGIGDKVAVEVLDWYHRVRKEKLAPILKKKQGKAQCSVGGKCF